MKTLEDIFSDFGQLFLRLHRLMDRRMTVAGASLARTKLLFYLDQEGPLRSTDIASFFGLSPRTVTDAIDGLERDGMVVRKPDLNDRRARLVAITPAGKLALEATGPLRLELIDHALGVLTKEERRQFAALIDKMSQAVALLERPESSGEHS
jgi:DNA-binding MarR family transcriptional regulator